MRFAPALATTRRTQLRDGDAEHDPVQHASTGRRYSRTGRTIRAWCGAQAYTRAAAFDPEHPRACRACVKAIAAEA